MRDGDEASTERSEPSLNAKPKNEEPEQATQAEEDGDGTTKIYHPEEELKKAQEDSEDKESKDAPRKEDSEDKESKDAPRKPPEYRGEFGDVSTGVFAQDVSKMVNMAFDSIRVDNTEQSVFKDSQSSSDSGEGGSGTGKNDNVEVVKLSESGEFKKGDSSASQDDAIASKVVMWAFLLLMALAAVTWWLQLWPWN